MNKPGTLNVVYFVHPSGHITLAPYTNFPTLPGCNREVANTLPECRALQAKLCEQERRELEREFIYDEAVFGARRDAIRDRMYARMQSSFTTQYEKDFIREWIKLKDEEKSRKYLEYFEHRQMYLSALENDSHKSRSSDAEEFHEERIKVQS